MLAMWMRMQMECILKMMIFIWRLIIIHTHPYPTFRQTHLFKKKIMMIMNMEQTSPGCFSQSKHCKCVNQNTPLAARFCDLETGT